MSRYIMTNDAIQALESAYDRPRTAYELYQDGGIWILGYRRADGGWGSMGSWPRDGYADGRAKLLEIWDRLSQYNEPA